MIKLLFQIKAGPDGKIMPAAIQQLKGTPDTFSKSSYPDTCLPAEALWAKEGQGSFSPKVMVQAE